MADNMPDLWNVPLTELLANWGIDIVNAQFEMDRQTFELVKALENGEVTVTREDGSTEVVTMDKISFGDTDAMTLLQLGLIPQFFQLAENNIEIKMDMTWKADRTSTVRSLPKLGADTSNLMLAVLKSKLLSLGLGVRASASVSSITSERTAKYRVQAEATSSLRVKIVPVEPSTILQSRIQKVASTNPNKK